MLPRRVQLVDEGAAVAFIQQQQVQRGFQLRPVAETASIEGEALGNGQHRLQQQDLDFRRHAAGQHGAQQCDQQQGALDASAQVEEVPAQVAAHAFAGGAGDGHQGGDDAVLRVLQELQIGMTALRQAVQFVTDVIEYPPRVAAHQVAYGVGRVEAVRQVGGQGSGAPPVADQVDKSPPVARPGVARRRPP